MERRMSERRRDGKEREKVSVKGRGGMQKSESEGMSVTDGKEECKTEGRDECERQVKK